MGSPQGLLLHGPWHPLSFQEKPGLARVWGISTEVLTRAVANCSLKHHVCLLANVSCPWQVRPGGISGGRLDLNPPGLCFPLSALALLPAPKSWWLRGMGLGRHRPDLWLVSVPDPGDSLLNR